jgi:hypothetical protein
MARLRLVCPKPEDERLRGLSPTDSRTGFRPVDANDVDGRRTSEPVRDRAAQDGTAHVSTVELRNASRNEFQTDNRPLIPGFRPVNPEFFRHLAAPPPQKQSALVGIKQCANLSRIDRKITRDLRDREPHTQKDSKRCAIDWPAHTLGEPLLQQAIQLVSIA